MYCQVSVFCIEKNFHPIKLIQAKITKGDYFEQEYANSNPSIYAQLCSEASSVSLVNSTGIKIRDSKLTGATQVYVWQPFFEMLVHKNQIRFLEKHTSPTKVKLIYYLKAWKKNCCNFSEENVKLFNCVKGPMWLLRYYDH